MKPIAVVASVLALFVFAVGGVLVQLGRSPSALVIDSRLECPAAAAQQGIGRYLQDPRRKRHAVLQLVHAERVYDDRRMPPSFLQRVWDHQRVSTLAHGLTEEEVVRLLCASPIVVVRGKRLAGVPSVAVEILGRQTNAISEEEFFLIACGVIGSETGARRALMALAEGQSDIDLLAGICNGL